MAYRVKNINKAPVDLDEQIIEMVYRNNDTNDYDQSPFGESKDPFVELNNSDDDEPSSSSWQFNDPLSQQFKMTRNEKYQYYKNLVIKSKPFWMTKLLKTWWMYVFYMVLLCVYGYTLGMVKTKNLAYLDEIKSGDYFAGEDHRTQKMFVMG